MKRTATVPRRSRNVMVRLDESTFDALVKVAREQGRPLANQVWVMVREAVTTRPSKERAA